MPNIAITFCEKHQINKIKNKQKRNICPLCRSEFRKKYKQENKESIKEKRRIYYEENKEAHMAWTANNRKLKPEVYIEYGRDAYERRDSDHDIRRAIRPYKSMTVEKYKNMVADCGSKCTICKKPETRTLRGTACRLCLDHDHSTQEIRGLLCAKCNKAIGLMNDDVGLLQSAIDYLIKHKKAQDDSFEL